MVTFLMIVFVCGSTHFLLSNHKGFQQPVTRGLLVDLQSSEYGLTGGGKRTQPWGEPGEVWRRMEM